MNQPAPDPKSIGPGFEVDRYRIVRPLGQGGMATVFLAEHRELGTKHAIKVVREAMAVAHARLLREGQLQASLTHRNVVGVTDVIMIGGMRALVMEYVSGPELHRLLGAYQPTIPQADDLARQILAGVAEAHSRGLVHRDLKPGNVLVAVEEDRAIVKVADFGLAKDMSDISASRTRSGTTMGTPLYMAPEQFRNAKYADQRADVFSLGALLYELLTGIQAFSGDDLIEIYTQTAHRGYRPLREVLPQVPVRMERAIEAALDPDRETRIQSASALLEVWADGSPVPVGAWERPHLDIIDQVHEDGATVSDVPIPVTRDAREAPHARPPGSQPTMAGYAPPPSNLRRRLGGIALLSLFGLGLGLVGGLLVGVVMLALRNPEPVEELPPPIEPEPVPTVEPPEPPAPPLVPVRDVGPGWTWHDPARFTFGDDALHVPPDMLRREYNWPGRTIGNRNPGYPLILTSPEHEVELDGFAISPRITWAAWEALGGEPAGDPDALASGLSIAAIEAVLNAKSIELGLTPAMADGARIDGDGLRLPTEAEWEHAVRLGPDAALELVIDPEPAPAVPNRGTPVQVLRGRASKGRTFRWRATSEGTFRIVSSASALQPDE